MTRKPNDLPHHLRAWRNQTGLTLAVVAAKLGIAVNTLSDKELGKRPVDTEELQKLAEIYGCQPWMLLAAPPGSEDLVNISKAVDLLQSMSAPRVEAWLNMGDQLKSPE